MCETAKKIIEITLCPPIIRVCPPTILLLIVLLPPKNVISTWQNNASNVKTVT